MKNNNLIILAIVLFALYYFYTKKETMADFSPMYGDERKFRDNSGAGGSKSTSKTRYCSQNAINDAYNTWTFGSPKFVR